MYRSSCGALMKIEKIGQKNSTNDHTFLSLSLLSHRVGDELCDLVNICRNVENALGDMIGTPKEALDQPIMAIQGLDRMRQTLEDLERLSRLIARLQAFSNIEVPKEDLLRSIVLAGLAGRLASSDTAEFAEEQELQDEVWQ